MTRDVTVRRCVARDFFTPIALIARNVRRRAMAFAVSDVVAFLEFKELYKLLLRKSPSIFDSPTHLGGDEAEGSTLRYRGGKPMEWGTY